MSHESRIIDLDKMMYFQQIVSQYVVCECFLMMLCVAKDAQGQPPPLCADDGAPAAAASSVPAEPVSAPSPTPVEPAESGLTSPPSFAGPVSPPPPTPAEPAGSTSTSPPVPLGEILAKSYVPPPAPVAKAATPAPVNKPEITFTPVTADGMKAFFAAIRRPSSTMSFNTESDVEVSVVPSPSELPSPGEPTIPAPMDVDTNAAESATPNTAADPAASPNHVPTAPSNPTKYVVVGMGPPCTSFTKLPADMAQPIPNPANDAKPPGCPKPDPPAAAPAIPVEKPVEIIPTPHTMFFPSQIGLEPAPADATQASSVPASPKPVPTNDAPAQAPSTLPTASAPNPPGEVSSASTAPSTKPVMPPPQPPTVAAAQAAPSNPAEAAGEIEAAKTAGLAPLAEACKIVADRLLEGSVIDQAMKEVDDDTENRKLAKAQYMRFYRSIRSNKCPDKVKEMFEATKKCQTKQESDQLLQALCTEFKNADEDWACSSIIMEDTRTTSTSYLGVWKWMTKQEPRWH